jgi:putative DNA primase/helicase
MSLADARLMAESMGLTMDTSKDIEPTIDKIHDYSQSDLSIILGESHFHENARYVATWDSWLLWDGNRWLPDKRLKHLSLIGAFLKIQAEEMVAVDNSAEARRNATIIKSAPFRNSVREIIKTDQQCSVLHDIFDTNLLTLGTPAGTVFLEQGEIVDSMQEYYITKSTAVTPVNEPPMLWISFLNTIFGGDDELISFMQRACGYALTGLTTEEKVFFCYGTGANGKSKFLETVFYVLGDYARRAPASLFLESKNDQHPTNMAGLQGARLVLGSELPSGKTWNEETLKDMTGGDTITARLMRQDYFDYSPQFTLFIAGNHQPRLKNVDESMVRRLVLIPFDITIPKEKRDHELGDKLKAEAGEILNWCIQGAVQYFEKGLEPPQKVIDASAAYIENEDITGEFIGLFLESTPSRRVGFDDVYQAYSQWMKDAGNNYIKRDNQFRKELKERQINVTRSNSVYWVESYHLKQDTVRTSRADYANRK